MMPIMQICLAAEKCKHLAFDSRLDMWWSYAGLHCGDAPAEQVTFGGILLKVGARSSKIYSWPTRGSAEHPHLVPLWCVEQVQQGPTVPTSSSSVHHRTHVCR